MGGFEGVPQERRVADFANGFPQRLSMNLGLRIGQPWQVIDAGAADNP